MPLEIRMCVIKERETGVVPSEETQAFGILQHLAQVTSRTVRNSGSNACPQSAVPFVFHFLCPVDLLAAAGSPWLLIPLKCCNLNAKWQEPVSGNTKGPRQHDTWGCHTCPSHQEPREELGTVVNYPAFTCDGLQRHHSLLAFSVETKRSTRGPTAFACLWREIQANISTTDTSSLGNHLSEHRVCSLCLSSRSSMLVRGSPFVLASPVLSLPLHLARSSKSPSLFVLRMWDLVRIQHLVWEFTVEWTLPSFLSQSDEKRRLPSYCSLYCLVIKRNSTKIFPYVSFPT